MRLQASMCRSWEEMASCFALVSPPMDKVKEVRVAHGVRTEDSYQLEDFNYLTSSEGQSQMQFSITSNVSANVVSFHPHFNLIEPEFPTCLVDRVPFFL